MASSTTPTPHHDTETTPRDGARYGNEREGPSGVSDERRAELGRMEAAAGLSNDAPDAAQRPHRDASSADTRQPGNPEPINPDIDKR